MTVLLLLVFAFLATIVPNARAQTTEMFNVSYPKKAAFDLETRTTDPPLLVKATVSYSDTKPSYFLAVGIFDLDDSNLVRGIGNSAPEPCNLNVTYAMCLIGLRSTAGVEYVEFLIPGTKPIMSLAIIAVLYDGSGGLIYDSESDYEFTITLTASLVLNVRAPSTVPVSVDGMQQPKGNVWLNLVPGPHSLSVPNVVSIDNVTRMKFTRWSDGVNQTGREFYLSHHMTLTAIYTTQYLLSATSQQQNASGTGWYNEGANATFSVPAMTLPMIGPIGLLGGKWRFQGWYENGELLTSSINGSIIMNSSHSITARWEPDYVLPLLIVGTSALAVLAVFVYRRKQRGIPRNRRKRARTSSRRRKA